MYLGEYINKRKTQFSTFLMASKCYEPPRRKLFACCNTCNICVTCACDFNLHVLSLIFMLYTH